MITVTVDHKDAKSFNTLDEAVDYLHGIEDGFIYDDMAWHDGLTLSVVVDGDGKQTVASLKAMDGETWKVDRDGFHLFAEGEML